MGVELSNNGSYKLAQKSLYQKASRVLFKLKTMAYGSEVPEFTPSTLLKMYDQLIKPISVYGSETWGIETLNGDSIEKLMKSFNDAMMEKLNLFICSHIHLT